jgi:hypothetical protein
VPKVKFALQVVPQLIPAGLLVTVPVPVPARVTLSSGPLKVAVTCWLAVSVTTQVGLVPVHPPPLHWAKVEFAPAVALSVTCVPLIKLALHDVCGQLIPGGLLVTEPAPVPPRITDNIGAPWLVLKVAVTVSFALSVTTQVRLLLQVLTDQLARYEFAPGVAVSVT